MFWLSSWCFAAFVLLCAVFVYLPVVGFDFLILDDPFLTYANPYVTAGGWSGIWGVFSSYDPKLYIPFTLLTFMGEHALVGRDPTLYHVTNMVLHGLCGVSMFFVLRRVLSYQLICLFCALLFVVHPMNIEAVVWVSSRKDLLFTLFSLLSLLCFLRGSHFFSVLTLFVLALLSKPTAIILPLAFLSFSLWKGERWDTSVTRLRLYFAISFLFFVIAAFGKGGNVSHLSLLQTAVLSGEMVMQFLATSIVPSLSSPASMLLRESGIGMSSIFLSLCTVALGILSLCHLSRRSNLALGYLVFCIALVPVASTFAVQHDPGQFITVHPSIRHAYFAQLGLLLVLGTLLCSLYSKSRYLVSTICVALLCFCTVSTRSSLYVWKDSETLFAHISSLQPTNHLPEWLLGLEAMKDGDTVRAQKHLQESINRNPSFSKAHLQLGYTYGQQERYEEAKESFARALEINPHNKEAKEYLEYIDN